MRGPFDYAASALGLNAREQSAALRSYLTTGGQNLDPATRAWCASFVNASLSKAGLPTTGSDLARSFLKYGQAVDAPQQGDIAVFSRGNPRGPLGHVGFYAGTNSDGTIRVLGGNQGGGQVNYSNFPASRLLGFRRPGDGRVQVASNDPGFVPGASGSPPSVTITAPSRPSMDEWQKTAQSMQGPASANEAMAQILRDDAEKRGYASWSPQTPSPNDAPAQWNPIAAVQRLFGGQAPEQAKAAIAPPAPAPASPEASSMPADVPLPPPRPMAAGGPGDGGFHLTPQPRMQGGFNDPQQALAALLMNEAYA